MHTYAKCNCESPNTYSRTQTHTHTRAHTHTHTHSLEFIFLLELSEAEQPLTRPKADKQIEKGKYQEMADNASKQIQVNKYKCDQAGTYCKCHLM